VTLSPEVNNLYIQGICWDTKPKKQKNKTKKQSSQFQSMNDVQLKVCESLTLTMDVSFFVSRRVMMGRMWGTVPSARDSSWFFG